MRRRDDAWFRRLGMMVMGLFFVFVMFLILAEQWNAPQLIWWAWALHFLAFILMFTEVEGYLENIQVILEDTSEKNKYVERSAKN